MPSNGMPSGQYPMSPSEVNYHPYTNPHSQPLSWDLYADLRGQSQGAKNPFGGYQSGAHGPSASMHPSWPFFRSDDIEHDLPKQERVIESSYYASMPGAIRGQVPVIFYPSCSKDAHFQPAVISYCTSYHSNYGRSMKDAPAAAGSENEAPSPSMLNTPADATVDISME